MKHIDTVTKATPKKADEAQDILCVVASAIAGMVEAKGGSAPMISWLDDKCDLPEPNP